MNIHIICVGKLKEGYLREACREYLKRLTPYAKTEIIEVREEENLKKEGENILRRIKDRDYCITLEIKGRQPDSEELAAEIADLGLTGRSSICFVIGGSEGLDPQVSARADMKLSFSRMTFPHQLMRVILLEQIYRSFKINSNETYHK